MSKLMYAEAEYMQPYHIDISHLKINYDDIEHHWCKYGTLYIEMKDGTTHEVDGEHLDADYKWPIELKFYDMNYNNVTEDQDGNG